MHDNLDKKLILICAEAGYGKTTLLAQVCAELDKPYVFFSADASDSDLATFLHYMVSGIQQHCSDFGQRTRKIISQTRNIEILVGTFLNEFVEKINGFFLVILDDYHHFQGNAEINNALNFLLRHMPINLHVIVSTRSVPPLNLSYYFAKQELFRMEKEQLRFTLNEIQDLLKEVYGLKIPGNELHRIEKHSEGWITAIQLILQKISACGGSKAKETLNGYVASGDEIFNYFAGEVCGSQNEKLREFLMKTSIIDDMNSEICNYLLKIRDAKRILEYLETNHLFITRSLDYNYRYHPIFREFLQSELKRKITPARISALHRRVATYFEKKNSIGLAVRHYRHAGDIKIVVKMVLENIQSYFDAGRINMVEKWLSGIPEKYYYKFPRLFIHRGHLFRLAGLFDKAEKGLNEARKNLAGTSCRKDRARVWFELATISCMHGDTGKAYRELTMAKKICKRLDPELRIAMSNCMAIIMYNKGRYKASEKHILTGIEECERYKKGDRLSGLICNLGVLYSQQGDFAKAEECYVKAIKFIEDGFFWIDMPLVYENLAGIKIIKGEYDQALDLLRKGIDLSLKYRNRYSLCLNYLRLGMLYHDTGKHNESLECLNKAIGIASDLSLREVLIESQCAMGALYLDEGKPERAKRYLFSAMRLAGKDRNRNVQLNLFRGKIAMSEKNYDTALRIFRKVLRAAQKNALNYTVAKCHVLLAKTYEKARAVKKLKKSLKEAVRLADTWDYRYLLQKELSHILIKTAQENRIHLPDVFTKPPIVAKKSVLSYSLQITLFGSPVILRNKKPVKNRYFTPKAKKLLCYFILHRNQPLTKERIVEQLWPKCEFPKGENRFYFTLHAIRKALTGEKRKAYEPAVILYRGQQYQLDPDIAIDSDVARFEGFISQAKASLSVSGRSEATLLLRQAVGIYRAPFCEGWYDNWVEEFRQSQENMYLKALSLLVDMEYDGGLFEECINHTQQYLMVDKYNETVNCKLISSLLKIGARQKAIAHYESFNKILSELNLTPVPAIASLRKQLYT